MPELRVGHDYHLAEARCITTHESQVKLWEAHCNACGWVGPERHSKGEAWVDAVTHDTTENESV